MARVLPSEVVRMIENAFPWVAAGNSGLLAHFNMGPTLSALVDLTEQIPDAMLQQFTSQKYRDFIWAVSSLRHLAAMLETGQSSAAGGLAWPSVGPLNALSTLWLLLKECPDEAITESTPGLAFLKDDGFRMSVQQDISSAEAAFNNGEWKAATVMAGAALEALLLWTVLQYPDDDRREAVQKQKHRLGKLDVTRPETWDLDDYIKVVRELGAIFEDTSTQAGLARGFRNLIHPGPELRKQMKCDRGTARSALAAVDHVVRDLVAHFSDPSKSA